MKITRKTFVLFVFSPILLVLFLIPNFKSASADSLAVDIGFCLPNVSLSTDSKIHIQRGDVLKFACNIVNSGNTAEVLLVGEVTKNGEVKSFSSASSALSIAKGEESVSKLVFTPLLQNGNYNYSIYLLNSSDGSPVGRKVVFNAVLDSPAVKIESVTLDKKSYAPGDTARLTLTVSLPEGGTTTVPFMFDVATSDTGGNTCAYLEVNKPILNTKETHAVKFLEGTNSCRVSSVLVRVKTKEGIPVDSISTDVSLDAGTPVYYMEWFGKTVLSVFVLVLVLGYIIWRISRHKDESSAEASGGNATKL